MKISLIETIRGMVQEAFDLNSFREKYVDGGQMSPEDFDKIISISSKIQYQSWLLTMVSNRIIKMEDLYKYNNYFNLFTKYKDKYPIKDINQIKTSSDLAQFIETSHNIIDYLNKIKKGKVLSGRDYVSESQIQKLRSVGIELMGHVEGYQIFKVPPELKGNKEAWKVYKNILGRCSSSDDESRIAICTIGNFDRFNHNFHGGPYYVIFNMSDPKSPYQFNYESNQFVDKNDVNLV